MTIIKRYSENKDLIAEDKSVDIDNVELYVSQYGPEYVQGYLQALTDFEKDLQSILWKEKGSNYSIPSTAPRVHSALKIFYTHKTELLEKLQSLGIKLPSAINSPNPMQD